jgi:hypothetical protein
MEDVGMRLSFEEIEPILPGDVARPGKIRTVRTRRRRGGPRERNASLES